MLQELEGSQVNIEKRFRGAKYQIVEDQEVKTGREVKGRWNILGTLTLTIVEMYGIMIEEYNDMAEEAGIKLLNNRVGVHLKK
jgi:nitric oxide synthase oxygenase domain/subunit